MREQRGIAGLLGIVPSARSYHLPSDVWDSLVRFLGHAMGSLLDRAYVSRQVAYLNTYLTVSTLLGQSLGLHDLVETILYFCTDVVLAEEASVLLLDQGSGSFIFFQTEGASKPMLSGKTFPADMGIAGAVLSSRKSEVINDVQRDPRFYGRFDAESGVQTRNMIAIPLVAGQEPVGVLEVINKSGGLPFTDDDHLLLHFIADEIAFAVRNARIFEYVVKSYCKQKQGSSSCEGCHRPLGSWTPCVKYRESII
jgi:GAF domain-containing protein